MTLRISPPSRAPSRAPQDARPLAAASGASPVGDRRPGGGHRAAAARSARGRCRRRAASTPSIAGACRRARPAAVSTISRSPLREIVCGRRMAERVERRREEIGIGERRRRAGSGMARRTRPPAVSNRAVAPPAAAAAPGASRRRPDRRAPGAPVPSSVVTVAVSGTQTRRCRPDSRAARRSGRRRRARRSAGTCERDQQRIIALEHIVHQPGDDEPVRHRIVRAARRASPRAAATATRGSAPASPGLRQ